VGAHLLAVGLPHFGHVAVNSWAIWPQWMHLTCIVMKLPQFIKIVISIMAVKTCQALYATLKIAGLNEFTNLHAAIAKKCLPWLQ
jgi:hypothetical protein